MKTTGDNDASFLPRSQQGPLGATGNIQTDKSTSHKTLCSPFKGPLTCYRCAHSTRPSDAHTAGPEDKDMKILLGRVSTHTHARTQRPSAARDPSGLLGVTPGSRGEGSGMGEGGEGGDGEPDTPDHSRAEGRWLRG